MPRKISAKSNVTNTFNDNTRAALVPVVIESGTQGERSYDVFSRLLKDRHIVFYDQVNQGTAAILIAQLMFLFNHNPKKEPIHLHIMSPGGDVDAGMAVYDIMQFIKAQGTPIHTYATGRSMSMGSVLLVAGSDGCRHAQPSANVMIHGPSGGSRGKSVDMDVSQREINHIKHRMALLYEAHTKMSYDQAMDIMNQSDYFMRAEEAKKLGVVDHIIYPTNDAKVAAAMKQANDDHLTMRDEPSPGLPRSGKKPAVNDNGDGKGRKNKKSPGMNP